MSVMCKNCVVGLLGSCAGDYCAPEREPLLAQARRAAEAHGHHLGAFVKVEDVPVWKAQCTGCGREAVVTLDPQPGERAVSVDALLADCPARATAEELEAASQVCEC